LSCELDGDDSGLFHLKGGEPFLEAPEHALLRRQAHRIAADADEAQERAQQRRTVQDRIELRPFAKLQFVDDVACQIARENELYLARHRLLIDRSGHRLARLLGFRPQEDVLAGLDQQPRLRLVARRDQADRQEGRGRGAQRQDEDRVFAPPQRAAERAKIDLLDGGLHDAKPRAQLRTRTHKRTSTRRAERASRSFDQLWLMLR